MSFNEDGFPEDWVGATYFSTPIEGYCVFCECHVTDILAHHTLAHGGNDSYEVDFYNDASSYLAPSRIKIESELENCERCKAILYNHRIKNHRCPEICLFTLDEGRGNEYCLMCQLRCDDVSVHWYEAHKSNAIYKIEEIHGLRTLLPKYTEIYVDLEYFNGHDNHELCQRFTYKNRIRRPCISDSNSHEVIQTIRHSSSGHHMNQDIGLTSQHESRSLLEGRNRRSVMPSMDENQDIGRLGMLPPESNTIQQGSYQNNYQWPTPQEPHSSYAGPQQSVITPLFPTVFELGTSNESSSSYSGNPINSQIEQGSGGTGVFPLQSSSNSSYHIQSQQQQQGFSGSLASVYRHVAPGNGTTFLHKLLQKNGMENKSYCPQEASNSKTGRLQCMPGIENAEHAGQELFSNPIAAAGSSQGALPNIEKSNALYTGLYWNEKRLKSGYCVICNATIGNIYDHSKHESVEKKPFNGRRVIAPVGSFGRNELSKCEACKRVFHSKNIPFHNCGDPDTYEKPKIFNDEKSKTSGFCAICEREYANLKQHSTQFHKDNKTCPLDIRQFKGRRVFAPVDSFEVGNLTKCEICKGVFLTERFHNHDCVPQTAPARVQNQFLESFIHMHNLFS